MFQVNFSEQSIRQLDELDKFVQMGLVEQISSLTAERLKQLDETLGRFHRNGRTLYRLRAGEYRLYFERNDVTLFCHYVLHKNTLTDFIYRFKLPISEEQMLEQHDSFWRYLETLKK
jgi:mRNA interferase RelE/StbE